MEIINIGEMKELGVISYEDYEILRDILKDFRTDNGDDALLTYYAGEVWITVNGHVVIFDDEVTATTFCDVTDDIHDYYFYTEQLQVNKL